MEMMEEMMEIMEEMMEMMEEMMEIMEEMLEEMEEMRSAFHSSCCLCHICCHDACSHVPQRYTPGL